MSLLDRGMETLDSYRVLLKSGDIIDRHHLVPRYLYFFLEHW